MVAAALLTVGSVPVARATNLTWNKANTDTYSWINPANWTAGTGYPDAIGDVANLNNNIAGTNTITLDANVTLAGINIGDSTGSDQFLIQSGIIANPSLLPLAAQAASVGAGSIVLDAVGYDPLLASVTINKTGTGVADEIAALVYFNDPLTITASSGKITLSGGLRSGQSDIIFAGGGAIELKTATLITGGNVIKNDTGTLTFSFANTYGGATTLNAGTLVAGVASALPTRTPLTVGASATFNFNNLTQVFGSLAGSGLVTSTGGTGGIVLAFGRDDTSTTFTGRLSPTTAANMAVTKAGAGTFTLAPSVASTYTGSTTLWGGNFLLDFVNSGTNTSLMGASPLVLTGGNFTMKGRAGLATTQTLGAVTVNQQGGAISVIAGDTFLTKLAVGSISFGTGSNAGTLLVSAPTNTQVTTSTNTALANGIYGAGRAVFFDGTNYDWLTSVSGATPYVLSGLAAGSYVAFPSAGPGVATTNYLLAASQTQTAVSTVGTLKLAPTAAGQSLATGTFDITFGASGGAILVTGTNAFTISGTGALKTGASGGDLIIHNYNSGGLTISAPIKDNTTSAVTRLITAGTGVTTLTGTNTFTGDVMINSGVLSFNNAGASGTGTLGLGVAKPVYIRDGATLRYTGTTATLAAATSANSHTIWLPGGNATIEITNAAAELTIAGVIGGTTAYSGGLTKTGPGTLTFAGGNAFTGPLIIAAGKVVSGGTIGTDGSTNRIADTAPVVIAAGAIWEMTGSDSVGSLAGAGTLQIAGSSARNPGLGADNTNTTFSGLLGGTQGNSISKRGSGVWTVAMPVTSTWVGGNTYLDAGVIRVATGMGQQFNPTATLVVNNAAQSAIFDLNGSSQAVGGLNFYNSASTIASQGLVLLGNGGTLTLGGNITVNAHNGNGTQAAGIIGSAGATLSMGNAQRTITVYKSLNLAPGEAELVIDAVIAGGGTGGGWIKSGAGTLRIQGQNQLNGTVSTRFIAGTTILDYATAASTAVSDRLNPQGIIDLQGGSVSLLGNPNFDVSQSVAGLIIPNIAAGNTGGYSSIDLYTAGGKNLVLNLGPITQRVAGTVRFTLPSGTQSSVNGITTTSGNDLFTGLVGTLGASLTVTDGAGATSFATRVGTNIVPVTMASRDTLSGVLNGENITDVTGYAGSLLNVVSPISLRFNAAGSSLLSVPDGGILKVISGGILQTSAAATSTLSLAGVNTTSGAATITTTSTAGLLVGMQVSGTGIPAGARVTQVVDGTTFLIDKGATATNSGTATAQAITVIQGGTLRSPTRELLVTNDTLGWYPNVLGDPNSFYPTKRLLITSSIDGQQGITKSGNGVLALRAGNQANDFSGLIQLLGGVLELGRSGRGSFAIGDSAPIAFSNVDGSTLRMLQDGLTLTGGAGATAIGSPVLKVDSIIGLSVGQALFGTGINPGTTVSSLAFTGNYTSVAAVALTGAATTNTSFNVTVADTTGLVVGQPVSGTGIPAGAYITAVGTGTITLSVAATATNPSVNLTAAAVTQVTTSVNHGIANNESITISDAAAGYNGTFAVIVDPVDAKRFVFTGATGGAVG
ncbi:MAG: beta strand repeat-containing protein, partial [Opitutales bacterium]